MNPMSEQEFQDYCREAYWQVRSQNEQLEKEFQLNTFPRFDWDQWRGEMIWSSGGTPKVVAKIQVTGIFSTKLGYWLWSWANSGLLEPVRRAVLKTRQWGEERGIPRLIQPKWGAKESDAWEMSAITAKLHDAKGTFRSPAPDGFTFMMFTDIRAVADRKRIFGARACMHVLTGGQPILLVSRELDGEVLAMCGGESDTTEALRPTTIDKLIALEPELSLLADMPDGWAAMREGVGEDWARSKSE